MNAVPATIAAEIGPLNIEAEQALLGALMENPDAFGPVSAFLEPEHFAEAVHQRIFVVMRDMIRAGRKPTPVTLKDHLPYATPINGEMTLGQYVAHLMGAAVSADAIGFARAVHDLAVRRELIAIGADMRSLATEAPAGQTPKAQIDAAIERLSILAAAGLRRSQRQSTAGAAAERIIADMESEVPADPPVSTGLLDLDRIIGGYRRGNLVIMAGRPGMGKSTLAGSSALKVAMAGHGVLFFSREMTKEELTTRLLTDLAWRVTEPVTYKAILDREKLSEEHRFLLRDAAKRLRDVPMIVDPQQGMTIAETVVRARRVSEAMARKGVRLGLIVDDHLGKVTVPRQDNRNLELGAVTNAAAEAAKELDACYVMLCQLNRQVEAREGHKKRPQLSDLRESGHIEEDADVVIGLYREAYYLAKQHEDDAEKEIAIQQRLNDTAHDLDAIVLKNRQGGEGMAKLWVHAACAAVRNRGY